MNFAELSKALDGDVHTDEASRRLVAQDASPYRVLPAALVMPRHAGDCEQLVTWANTHDVPLIPRGGGTGLAGQCVGSGVVVDCSRYMDAVLDVSGGASGADRVTVQPGVTGAALNAALAPYGRQLGPDPSTLSRATLGGMVGNNAWGPHAPVDGTTRDQVVAVDAVLADGRSVQLSALSDPLVGEAVDVARRQRLIEVVEQHQASIGARLPAPGSGLCSNNGYPLHHLLAGQPWRADDDAFNEAVLWAGAEGTLGLKTEITLGTRPIRRDRAVICAHFSKLSDALGAVAEALAAGACAVELLDRHLLNLTRAHPAQGPNRTWLQGDPAAVLLIEFADGGNPAGVARRLPGVGEAPVVTGDAVERAWALRRAALGLLMGETTVRRAVTGLEDTAVPVIRLPEYIESVSGLFAAEGVEAVYYGSVSLGLVHIRPLLDLTHADDRDRYGRLLDGLAERVAAFDGVWSTKHGDGRLRAPWLEATLGSEMVSAFRAVKSIWDPVGRFNPGKIVDAPDPLSDMRAAAEIRLPAVTGLDWSADRGLAGAIGRCQGAGACRQRSLDGGMCPSYQATREERHTTRGRANMLQQALSAPDPAAALAADDLHEALSLCLGCKACQHECPARVDLARLKSEALYQRHRQHGMSLRTRAIARFADLSALAGRVPGLANRLMSWSVSQRLAGLTAAPPALAPVSQRKALVAHEAGGGTRGAVLLALDPHVCWYEPRVGLAAIRVLEALGYSVRVSAPVSFGRAAISQGALDHARRELSRTLTVLQAGGADVPIIGLEPSELLTLRDEAPALLGNDGRNALTDVAGRALLFEEFLVGPGRDALGEVAPRGVGPVAVHGHCHAKAAGCHSAVGDALELLPDSEVVSIQAGCCGMAGAFGYVHADVSRDVAELALAPAVRALSAETLVVAAGTSCRQQIRRFTDRAALHPAEIFARALSPET